jgi:hypothetical protein
VRAAGENPVPLRADPFNGAGGTQAGRDRRPRSPEPHTCPHCNTVTWSTYGRVRCRYCDRMYDAR